MKLILGSRGSDLALTQTHGVRNALVEAFPDLEVVVEVIQTTGDKNLEMDLARPGSLDKGLFTKQLEVAILEGKVDAAVHSLKDLPVDLPAGLVLGAVSKREDPRDLLISKHAGGLDGLPQGATVGTSSARRKAILSHLRPDLNIVPYRGNVPTRLRKLKESDEIDATVLAAAGVQRLQITMPDGIHSTIVEELLPAPGQGALGIECREGDASTLALLAALHDSDTADCVHAERDLLKRLGGGCAAPLGALATKTERGVVTRSFYLSAPQSQ